MQLLYGTDCENNECSRASDGEFPGGAQIQQSNSCQRHTGFDAVEKGPYHLILATWRRGSSDMCSQEMTVSCPGPVS